MSDEHEGKTMEELRIKLTNFEKLIREVQQAGLLSGVLDGKYIRLSLDAEWFDDARMVVGDESEALKITLHAGADELREKLAVAEAELERLGRCNEQLSSSHAEQINHQNKRLAAAEARNRETMIMSHDEDDPQPEYCDCDGFHDGSCRSREIKRLQDKLAAAESNEAMCHCGLQMSKHTESNHMAVEMERPCPNESYVAGQISGLKCRDAEVDKLQSKLETAESLLSRLADYDLVMKMGGTNYIDRAIRVMNQQRNRIEEAEFAIRWMYQNVPISVQDTIIGKYPWILECRMAEVEQQELGDTPTFSYRNGEYFKDGKPFDVLLELCELTGENECYEGMKEGVMIRIANLEQEIAELSAK